MERPLQTVVETAEFLARSSKLMSDEQRARWWRCWLGIPSVARSCRERAVCERFASRWPGRGKSGGARVIYYFHSERLPVFALTVFAKNERANLTAAERNAMAAVVRAIKQQLER